MIAPLDLTTEQMEIYKLLYSKMNFDNYLVKYTLDQLATDSNPILLLTKKKVNRIIKSFIIKNILTVVTIGTKGNPTIYKVAKMKDLSEEHKGNEWGTQRERIGNTKGTNKTSDTNTLDSIEEHKGNEWGTQRERIGNTKGTPINDKDKDKEKYIYSNDFENFYSIYPNPFNKEQTYKNYKTLLKSETKEIILKATNNYIQYLEDNNKTDKNYFTRSTNFIGQKQEYKGYIDYEPINVIAINPWKVDG